MTGDKAMKGNGIERDVMQAWRANKQSGLRVGNAFLRGSSTETPFLRKIWRSTRTRWQRLALVAFVGWVMYALLLSPHGWLQLMAVRRQVQALESEVSELERRETWLGQMSEQMETDEQFYLDKRAREDLGYARENERVYKLTPNDEDDRFLTEGEIRGGERFSERRGESMPSADAGRGK